MAAIAAGNSDRSGACHGNPRQCLRVRSRFRERRGAPQWNRWRLRPRSWRAA